MFGDQVVVTVGSAEVSAVRLRRSTQGETRVGSTIVRSPISVAVDAAGEPVRVGGSSAQGPSVDGLLDRVGDPVPVRVGTTSWPAEHLVACVVAGVVTDSAAAVSDEVACEVSQLVLVVPDEWRDHRRSALEGSVATLTGLHVVTIGAATGLLGATPGSAGRVLVVAADARLRAHVCIRGDEGWQVQRFGRNDWGAHDVDDAVLDFVRDRSSSAQWEEDAVAVRAACSTARADLVRRTATEVELPSGESVRVVRADLELVAGEMTGAAVGQLLRDVTDDDGDDRPTRVLVTGALAALPMLVEVVSSATGEAVEHVAEEDAFERYAATGAAATAAIADVHEDVDARNAADTAGTAVLAPGSALPLRRTSRRRASVIAVAASLVAATSVAAMTVTDAGEAALLALVEGTVPQSAGSDRPMGDLAGAATLPALPWSGESDDADNVVDTGAVEGAGGGEGSEGDPGASSSRAGADGDTGDDTGSPTQDDPGDEDDKDDKDDKDAEEDKGKDEDATQSRTSSPDSSSSSTSSTGEAAAESTATSPVTAPKPNSAPAPDTADRTSTTPTPTPEAPAPTREPTPTEPPQPTSTGSEPSEPPASEDPSTSTTAPAAAETSTQSSSTSPATSSGQSEVT